MFVILIWSELYIIDANNKFVCKDILVGAQVLQYSCKSFDRMSCVRQCAQFCVPVVQKLCALSYRGVVESHAMKMVQRATKTKNMSTDLAIKYAWNCTLK